MVTPVSASSASFTTVETPLQKELSQLKEVLKTPLDDRKTVQIEEWHRRFELALSIPCNEKKVLDEFIQELTGFLIDSRYSSPLEEISYLGNDGKAYGEKGLLVAIAKMSSFYVGRSPCDPRIDKPFTVQRHPVVEAAVRWLKAHDSLYPPSVYVEQNYQELKAAGALPPIPMLGVPPYSLRRRLKAELAGMVEKLNGPDLMSSMLKDWHDRFTRMLAASVEEEKLLATFIGLLPDILKDPFGRPLEATSYLGNDGRVYGEKALCVYLSDLPKEFKGRSPFVCEKEALFFVSAHEAVGNVMKWLASHRAPLLPDSWVEQKYGELEGENAIPRIPTEERARRQERARRLAAERAAQENGAAEEARARQEAENKARADRVDGVFGDTVPEINQHNEEANARAAAMKARDAQRLRELQEELKRWRAEVDAADQRLDGLNGQLQEVGGSLSQTERDTIQLKVSIEETKKAIAEREASQNDGLIKTALIVAACYGISLCFPPAAAGTAGGSATTVAPTADGTGAMLGRVFPIG